MQAAFVDIGLDKAAFLYVGDIVSDPTFPGFSEEMDIKAGGVEGDSLEAQEDLPEPSEEAAAPQQVVHHIASEASAGEPAPVAAAPEATPLPSPEPDRAP